MLRRLSLNGVGPADHLEMEPVAPRLNLITGDNGLGKSFLLDTAWWALTRNWGESRAVPNRPDASISAIFDGSPKSVTIKCPWNPETQEWRLPQGRPPNPGIILYARMDGSFSVWDPARNYRLYTRADGSKGESLPAYHFTATQVMNGLDRADPVSGANQKVCLGLIADWRDWQRAGDPRFDLLRDLLRNLSPDEQPMAPGALLRPYIDDVNVLPSIRMPYGQDVPLTYAPAGVRQMCRLAYLLAWAISEHEEVYRRLGQPPSRQFILLIDEPETHLHPRWQRSVLSGLLQAIQSLRPASPFAVQMLVATHSPLILASAEPLFEPDRDALWKLDLREGRVVMERDQA